MIVADDHPIVCAGLRRILESDRRVEVVSEASDGRMLLRKVRAMRPDVVVVDVSMPELNGIDATRLIVREHAPTRVVVLSVHRTEAVVLDALAAGAAAYVVKDTANEELRRAVHAVAGGQSYFSPAIAGLLAKRMTTRGAERSQVSPRERQVVQLISEGRRLREIAASLFISIATVKSHRSNAMRKLGARTTAELIRAAIQRGFATL